MTINKKILLVEDDNFLRTVLSTDLSDKYSILHAQDGEEAYQVATDFKPDLILLDLNIPKIDGLSVLAKLREHPDPSIANVKVIVFTNLTNNAQIERAKELNVLEYVVKANATLDQITLKIEAALGNPVVT